MGPQERRAVRRTALQSQALVDLSHIGDAAGKSASRSDPAKRRESRPVRHEPDDFADCRATAREARVLDQYKSRACRRPTQPRVTLLPALEAERRLSADIIDDTEPVEHRGRLQ